MSMTAEEVDPFVFSDGAEPLSSDNRRRILRYSSERIPVPLERSWMQGMDDQMRAERATKRLQKGGSTVCFEILTS